MIDHNRRIPTNDNSERTADDGLRRVHVPTAAPVSVAGRIVGVVFVIAAICVAGAYVYENWPQQPAQSVVADSHLPSPSAPLR